jgi:hypothetical protein
MPYVTKLERKRREWMTLAEAVEYVATVEGFPANEGIPKSEKVHAIWWLRSLDTLDPALQQIRAALVDGEIPVKWASDTFFSDFYFADDDPPPEGTFWIIAAIYPSENYAVLDQKTPKVLGGECAPDPAGNKRQLLLLRSKVYELWPSTEMANIKDSSRSYGKTSPSLEEIEQVVREIYDSNSRPNILEAERLVREKLPTATRKLVRHVLKEPQFSAKRRPAGNSKKSSD